MKYDMMGSTSLARVVFIVGWKDYTTSITQARYKTI